MTNTIVAPRQLEGGDQDERENAGAIVHEMFNVYWVAIFFPLEFKSCKSYVCVRQEYQKW
jgi:hypothetical protein